MPFLFAHPRLVVVAQRLGRRLVVVAQQLGMVVAQPLKVNLRKEPQQRGAHNDEEHRAQQQMSGGTSSSVATTVERQRH